MVHDDRVIVISHANMDAWEVRTHRQTLIRFEGREWRVVERTVVPPAATRYALAPWDADSHQIAGVTVDYGAAYVAVRDRTAADVKRLRRVSGWLRLVSPLTGFLTARAKDRLEHSYGIDPVASTKQSVILETIVVLLGLALTEIGMVTGAFPTRPFLTAANALAPDAIVRWDRVLREHRPPPGFYEWVFTRWSY